MKEAYVAAVDNSTSYFCPLRNMRNRELEGAASARDTTPAELGENLRALRNRVESDKIAVHAQDIHDTLFDTGIDNLGDAPQFTQTESGEVLVTAAGAGENEISYAPSEAGRLADRTVRCLSKIASGQCSLQQ